MPPVTGIHQQAYNRQQLQRAAQNLAVVIRAAGLGSVSGLNRIGIGLVNEVKRTLSQPGGGRLYRIGRTPHKGDRAAGRRVRTHRASAPGEPPAVDTGRYRASWTHYLHRPGGAPVLFVGTISPIGSWLEFGTRKMAARPHLRPAVRKFTALIPVIVREEVAGHQRAAASALGRSLRIGIGVVR